jgi:hypothetical protein
MNFKMSKTSLLWPIVMISHMYIPLSHCFSVNSPLSWAFLTKTVNSVAVSSRKWTKLQVLSCFVLQTKNYHRYWCHLATYEHSVRSRHFARRIKLLSWLHLKTNRSKDACSSRSALKILKSLQFTLISPLEISKLIIIKLAIIYVVATSVRPVGFVLKWYRFGVVFPTVPLLRDQSCVRLEAVNNTGVKRAV